MAQPPYIIGITGGSASGKTTFLKKLMDALGDKACVVSQDDYYHSRENQPLDMNGIENFDTPESLDLKSFEEDIRKICQGQEVQRMEYTFNNPAITPRTIIYKPSPLLIVEGIFLLHHPAIAAILDLKIYVDAEEHVKLSRRILRDKVERGYDLEDVLYRYEYHVAPNYNRYIKPFRQQADLIVPNNHGFDRALEVLIGFLKNKTGN